MADKRLRLIVEAVTSQAQAGLRTLGNSIKQFGDKAGVDLEKPAQAAQAMGSEMKTLATVATIALADMAMRYGQMAIAAVTSAAEVAATNLALEASYKHVALQYDLGADAIIDALQRASKGTMDRFSAMAAASTAMRLGVASNVEEFEQLMKIVYVRARETGKSVADAWNWMATGIGRGSPRILDNLNILIKEEAVMQKWADTIGKDVDELTMLDRQQATLNAVLQQGAGDLETWNDTAYEGIDAFERYRATMTEFRQEIGEMLLPAVTDTMTELTKLPGILDQLGYIFGITVTGMGAGYGKLLELIKAGDIAGLLRDEVMQAAMAAEEMYAVQDAARKANAEWGQMYQLSAQARKGLIDVGTAAATTTVDLEALGRAQQKAADIMADYARAVAQENWQLARRVSDAQFSATQATENAAFDLYKIERDAVDRREDLMASAAIREEADTASFYNKLRYMRQDLNDALVDLEYEYQQERKQIMDKAPWWVRYSLQKEFNERDRIAKTGDKKALAAYDAALLEKIKAIDPAYATEFQKLIDQYKHKEQVEKREGRQSINRQKDDWEIQQREQDRAMNRQLYELERGLGYQREEWAFHAAQREESERHSMENIITDHAHALDRLWEDTQRKLADLVPLWETYGRDAMQAWINGMNSVPWPHKEEGPSLKGGYGAAPAGYEGGVPALGAGGGGGTTVVINNSFGGYTPYQGQQVAQQISNQIGQSMRRNYR